MVGPREQRRSILLALALLATAAVLAAACSPRARGLLINTARLAAGACAIALPAGGLAGVALGKAEFRGRRLLTGATVAAMFVPLQVQAAAWQTLLGFDGWTTGGGPADPWLDGITGAAWVHGWAAVPWVAMLTAWGLQAVERRLEEETLLDASAARVLLRVSLPRAAGSWLAAAAATVALCAAEIAVTDLFRVRTFAEEVYTQAALGSLSGGLDPAPDAAALRDARDLLLGSLIHWFVGAAALSAAAPLLPRPADVQRHKSWRLTRRTAPWLAGLLATGAALVIAIAVLAPAAGLFWKAGLATARTDDGARVAWTAGKAAAMTAWAPVEHGREIAWSLAVGGSAAALAVAIGIIATGVARGRRTVAWLLGAGAAGAFAVPGPLIGVGVIRLLAHGDTSPWAWLTPLYNDTIAAPLLVQVVRAAPLAGLVVWSHLATTPRTLLESAATEGAGPVRRWLLIAVPLRWPGIAAAAMCALAVATAEVSATLLVYPPGTTPLAVRMSQLLHYGVDDRVAALALAVWGFVLLLGWATGWGANAWQRRRTKSDRSDALAASVG